MSGVWYNKCMESVTEQQQGMMYAALDKYGLSYLTTKKLDAWTDSDIDKLIEACANENVAPLVLIPFNISNIKALLAKSYCRRCGECCKSNRFNLNDPGVMVLEDDLKNIAKHSAFSYNQMKMNSVKYISPERNDVRHLRLPCMLYKQGRCTIYRIRPNLCKIYPIKDSQPLNDGRVNIAISVRCDYGKDIYRSIFENQKTRTMSRLFQSQM
ncbi:YkgJ family cysteine cluster protein [Chloroflexota bacterium]